MVNNLRLQPRGEDVLDVQPQQREEGGLHLANVPRKVHSRDRRSGVREAKHVHILIAKLDLLPRLAQIRRSARREELRLVRLHLLQARLDALFIAEILPVANQKVELLKRRFALSLRFLRLGAVQRF